MAKIIQHQLFYPYPQALVWDYLTKAELVSQWLMPGDIQPVVGHEFTLTSKPVAERDFDGVFYCKVLEAEPFDRFSYSWKFGPGDGTLCDSVVDWELTEKDNGTEVLLTHRDFQGAVNPLMFASMEGGWLFLINKLLTVINTTNDGTTTA